MEVLKVNICGNITELTPEELLRWKYENPHLKENYYVIDKYERNYNKCSSMYDV
jgi:hypothetical protein